MYKITIEKTVVELVDCGKDWKVVGEEDGKPQYGYTPEIEKKREVTRTVYTQVVGELNVSSVIDAVNSYQ